MNQTFYHYMGSLTTQPCIEGAAYIVFEEVQYMTFDDYANFKRFWSGNSNFSANDNGNSCNTRPLNGRPVYYSFVSFDEWYASLLNQYMEPSNSAMMLSVCLVSTLLVLF